MQGIQLEEINDSRKTNDSEGPQIGSCTKRKKNML